MISKRVEDIWYGSHPFGLVLAPLGWLWCVVAVLRRKAYLSGLLNMRRLGVPVIVVGNISVGGTGKTPLVLWVAQLLQAHGYRPGIVGRGYGGKARHWPQQVRPDSDPVTVGDEAVLLARRSGCPVAVGPDRWACGEALVRHAGCDVIVSDDGLQHLALDRDIEIATIDGVRRHGNRRCLPAGPLREPPGRLDSVDMVVSNGLAGRGEFSMGYEAEPLRCIVDESRRLPLEGLKDQKVHAVAGIGDPERFFDYLRSQGLHVIRHPFPDHHMFRAEDIRFDDGLAVVMTEKDAVKCSRIAGRDHWYLPVSAKLPQAFELRLLSLLSRVFHGQEAA